MLRSILRLGAPCLLFVVACGEQRFNPQPLPELVVATVSRDLPPIAPAALLLNPGEAFLWDVRVKGITVARAELFVDETEVRSRLATNALASSFAHLRHELTTILDREHARPSGGEELLVEDDDTKSAAIPSGKVGHAVHSFHTAIGALRAWASADAKPGYLYVAHLGASYRIDVQQPIVEDLQGTPTLKLLGRIRMQEPVSIAIWVTADTGRVPMRIEISRGDSQVTAALVDE